MARLYRFGFWAALILVIAVPCTVALSSPLLAWRDPIYIAAGFSGVAGLALLLVQPLLAGKLLPGLSIRQGRLWHRWIGSALVLSVVLHVVGLWITSPPDVIDALTFRSPTPFSNWGVLAMWAAFAAALVAVMRRKLRAWRVAHSVLASALVAGTVAHAMLIEGTMGTASKAVLCLCVLVATGKLLFDRYARAGGGR